ncbi:tetratricopeptide repeat protein [Roseburia sp. 499]|uniref:tetratricopeptide repeat protein n=1 Tax=Roseburia sp. 499 TaxID=1261634 RepID=UPI0009F8987D|nr:tetratricopeptide repeat protein [Roseburia sp. 499]WVK69142.1 tetratricopeptide repeat protein [Roseburia sp. 499]
MNNRKTRKKSGVILWILVMTLGVSVITGCQGEESLKKEKEYRKAGISKMEEGDYAGAVESFQKALDQSLAVVGDLEIDICYYKAAAQYKSGDVEGALETYEALMNYDKKNGEPYYLRGCIYLKQGDVEKAKEDFNKALELKPNDYELYVSIYENLIGIGETDEAGKILDNALEVKGEEAEDYRERGHIYLLKGDYESARKELDKAINKEDTKALLYMAQVYEAQGNSAQAQALYESYSARNGSDSEALRTLGEMQMEQGNYQQALEFFQKALAAESVTNEQAIRKNEIIAYEQLRDFASAKEKMAAYVEDYPEDEQAQREFIFLQTR